MLLSTLNVSYTIQHLHKMIVSWIHFLKKASRSMHINILANYKTIKWGFIQPRSPCNYLYITIHNIILTCLILCWFYCCCQNSPDSWGMDSAGVLKVCCGVWHWDASSRSLKSCRDPQESDVFVHHILQMLKDGLRYGKCRDRVNTSNMLGSSNHF